MSFSSEHIAELNLLALFDSPSSLAGIKVHRHQADPETVAAAERLYQKGLITQKGRGLSHQPGLRGPGVHAEAAGDSVQ